MHKEHLSSTIELILGAKPPAKDPYRMPPLELMELWNQLDGLLKEGFIWPSKAPYGALVLFQYKRDGWVKLGHGWHESSWLNFYPIHLIVDLSD